MSDTDPTDGLNPSEARVRTLLEQLTAGAPRASESLTPRVIRTARWQFVVRRLLRNTGALAGSLVIGADLLLGLRRRPRKP